MNLWLLVFVPLSFTAPADSLPNGTHARVTRYEATMGTLAQQMYQQAPVTRLFAIADSLAPAPIPQAPGSKERVYVNIPADGVWHRVRIYSYDAAGNRSPGSNIASVMRMPPYVVPLAVSTVVAFYGLAVLIARKRREANSA